MPVPSKRLVMMGLLAGGYVRLHFNARYPNVVVPLCVCHDSQGIAMLAYGDEEPLTLPEISDEGVSAVLSFDGVKLSTYVPWAAVFMLTTPDNGALFWPEDVPEGSLAQSAEEAVEAAVAGGMPSRSRRARPDWLQLVD